MDAVKIAQVIVKNITEVQTPVGKFQGLAAEVRVLLCMCMLADSKQREVQWEDATEWKDSFLSFYSPNWI